MTTINNNTDNTIDERMTTTRKQKWEGKQLYGRFKRLINISHQKTSIWLRKGNVKRETESLLISALDNTIRTNHIKARIDKTQINSKCRLCVSWGVVARDTNYTDTCPPSRKLYKLDEPDTRDTAGEARTSS